MVLFALFAVDVLGTVAGIYAMRSRLVSAKVTMISAGVMIGVALFWIFPEIRQKSGLMHAGLVVVVALVALYVIDRFVYPVCPCCAHGGPRDRSHRSRLAAPTGTLIPLAIAICIHNLLDGWTAAISAYTTSNVGSGIALGLMAHKLPEAVVFGLMLRAATDRPNVALLSACATASAILVGGAAHSRGLWMVPEAVVIAASLALACSSFLFAGAHIFLRQQRHAGRRAAIGPLLLGLFVSAVFEQVVSIALGQWQ